jgi:hypothetical protein
MALDDFGTGYRGFTYLKQLPIDYLKIDIEFVRDLRENAASRNVVRGIVNLAQGFDLKTIGEGVEDQQTLDLLREFGVDYAQGYHIGRPAPLENESPPSLSTSGETLTIEESMNLEGENGATPGCWRRARTEPGLRMTLRAARRTSTTPRRFSPPSPPMP